MLGTASIAQEYGYEVTPVAGYNATEDSMNIGSKNMNMGNYATFGIEAQFNQIDFFLKPELSLLYSKADSQNITPAVKTDIYRYAINGVYEYKELKYIIPLAKLGIGYEAMSNNYSGNEDALFADLGVGAKIPFSETIALKLEAIGVVKSNSDGSRKDGNIVVLAGINFAFGENTEKTTPTQEVAEVAAVAQEEPLKQEEPLEEEIVENTSNEESSLKPAETEVAEEAVAATAVAASTAILTKADDDDNDGVENSLDDCKSTPAGYCVNKFGCILKLVPSINFEFASSDPDTQNSKNILIFAEFLKNSPAYNVELIGYADNIGSKKNNLILSQKRAERVKELLCNEGIATDRIVTKGMGEANPIATNATAEGRAQNRRIETKLIQTK